MNTPIGIFSVSSYRLPQQTVIVASVERKAPTHLPPADKYYADAQGKKGAALLKSLTKIVNSNEPTQYSYDKARDLMYGKLDDPGNKNVVTDVYTGKKYSGVTGLKSADRKGLTAEHVWPQSTGATEEAKTDLHHIISAEGTVNAVRNNLPLGDVKEKNWTSPKIPGVAEKSIAGMNANGVKVFEPRASMQGDLARMQLYFFTRYHGSKPKQYTQRNFKESLPDLLKWNKADPPDAKERARNEAIYKLQGNRNPFVDHPDWVDKVGFSPEMLRRTSVRKNSNAA